jgi:hypothetical protein
MKTIIAGSRTAIDPKILKNALVKCPFSVTSVVCGKARGADTLGELYARENDLELFEYPANWDKFGKSAGYKRNEEMAQNAEALIALWDGESRGTKHMIDLANKYNLTVFIHNYNSGEKYV